MPTPPQLITLTRSIQAKPAQVYAAFTRAQGWCAWCCESAQADPQVGGKLHIFTEGYNAFGEFTRLEPDRVVAFTWNGDGEPPTRIDVALSRQGRGTWLAFTVSADCPAAQWLTFSAFLERVWGRALNNLKAVLEVKPAQ